MTKYSLTVVLDDAVLKSGSTDKLVLGRKINGKINVLFTGASPVPAPGFQQLQKNNLFQWEDKFKVFFQTEVGKGVLVQSTSNQVDIDFGQLAMYKDNLVQEAETKGKDFFELEGSFAVDGAPPSLHVGVSMTVGSQNKYTSIYLDPDTHVSVTKIELQPQNEYCLFWKNMVRTEAMLSLAETKAGTFNFKPGVFSKTLRFGYATPDQPVNATEAPSWY